MSSNAADGPLAEGERSAPPEAFDRHPPIEEHFFVTDTAHASGVKVKHVGLIPGVLFEHLAKGDHFITVADGPARTRRRASVEEVAALRAFGDDIERDVLVRLGIDPDISLKDLLKLPLE